jgi:two-component system, sensor histidine kinase and response regulator
MGDRETLLVVDDNPVNLQLLHQYLASAGYRILVAEDGESAVEQAVEARPDIVLMDVLLPGMSGFDACRKLHEREETESTPVIFLTALSRTSDKIEGLRAGGVDYLTKPLQFEEVLARVEVHLEIVRLRRELETTNLELEERDRRRERLLSIIAHDLKSPMVTFVNATRDLACRPCDEEEFSEMLSALSERAERMNRFLETLLEWGRLQVESGAMSMDPFNLRDVIDPVLHHARDAAEAKRITIDDDVPADIVIDGNQTAAQTVVLNLVSNAVKFTPEGGRVAVSADLDGERVRVRVQDTGVGMSEDEVEQLLTSEHRLRRRGTAGEQGTGLGLLLSRDLVAGMSGSLSGTSAPGEGTTFTLELPGASIADK